jgi:hypothetical protein
MTNVKVTAALLETAGWTEPQVARYYKLLSRKQAHGLSSLSIADRRFYNSAAVACDKAQAAIDKDLRAAQTRRVSGKQPVETKLHYRFKLAELLNYQQRAELLPGEELAIVIIREEQMRALELYQPVLDQVDTSRRHQFSQVTEVELLELAAVLGRPLANYDSESHLAALRDEFEGEVSWDGRWDEYYTRITRSTVALNGEDALAFRAEVRPVVEAFTRSLPSVAKTVAG